MVLNKKEYWACKSGVSLPEAKGVRPGRRPGLSLSLGDAVSGGRAEAATGGFPGARSPLRARAGAGALLVARPPSLRPSMEVGSMGEGLEETPGLGLRRRRAVRVRPPVGSQRHCGMADGWPWSPFGRSRHSVVMCSLLHYPVALCLNCTCLNWCMIWVPPVFNVLRYLFHLIL